MSRGFVKEDDQEETPIVPPKQTYRRCNVNYVTQVVWTLNENKNWAKKNLEITDENERHLHWTI
jgi:transcription elongation factor GreB